MIFWPETATDRPGCSGQLPTAWSAESCQSPSEFVDRYAAATGRDLSRFGWYQAFSAWKLAIVLEGSYTTYLRGESRNPLHEFFGPIVDQLLVRAGRFAQ